MRCVYFKNKPKTKSEEKPSLIPFTKVYGFHQIIDRFSQPWTVDKTQLLPVYLQLLLRDLMSLLLSSMLGLAEYIHSLPASIPTFKFGICRCF